jgi:hypothetical protein
MPDEYEEYQPYMAAFAKYGLSLMLAETGGGCVALYIEDSKGNSIYTLGPVVGDRYQGFEVIAPDGNLIAAYQPVDTDLVREPDETAALIAPAILKYLSGDYKPLPDWSLTLYTEREHNSVVSEPYAQPPAWYDGVSILRGDSLEELERKMNTRFYELNKSGCHIHDAYWSPLSEYTVLIWYSYKITEE